MNTSSSDISACLATCLQPNIGNKSCTQHKYLFCFWCIIRRYNKIILELYHNYTCKSFDFWWQYSIIAKKWDGIRMLKVAATWCKTNDQYGKTILFVLILEVNNVSEQKVNEYLSWTVLNSNQPKKSVWAKNSEILNNIVILACWYCFSNTCVRVQFFKLRKLDTKC